MAYEIEIKKLGINGEGIGYINNTVTFIQGALPNETVEYTELERFKGYNKAQLLRVVKPSPDRVKPKCPIQEKCQVCSIMPLAYEKQIDAKKQLFFDAIYKYANYKIKIDDVVKDLDQYYYRNSIKLPVFNLRDKLAVGLHFRDTNHYVLLNDCIVQDKAINQCLRDVLDILNEYRYRAYDKKTKMGIRFLLVRRFGPEIMITFVIGKNTKIIDEALDRIEALENVVSINQTTNTKASNEIIVEPIKSIRGKKSINVPFNDFNFKLSPASFIQLNTKQAIKMYDIIKTMLGTNNQTILDLFCGVGTIGLYVNECAKNIVGVDNNRSSINDAKENAKKHRINHVKYYCDDVDNVIKLVAKKENIDAVIVDPPRTGLTDYTMESIIRSRSKKVIYVSCNPSTLGKDLSLLLKYYDVKETKLVDMFPQTMHVESVILLERKK